MALGTNQITITTHNIFIPELWDNRSQKERERALHLANFVYRRDDEVEAYGDVLNTQTISNFTSNAKVINTQVTLQAPAEANVPLTIDQHEEASFLVEDNAAAKSLLNLQREYVGKASYGVGLEIDTQVFANRAALTTAAVGTIGVALTDAVIVSAWETLSTNDVPEEDRAWFFHPSAFAELMQLTVFSSTDFSLSKGQVFTGNQANGLYVGVMYGSPVYLTNNVPVKTTGSPAVSGFANLYLHKEAFQLGMQKRIRVQIDYILEYLGYLTVVDAIFGTAIYRADHGVEIYN